MKSKRWITCPKCSGNVESGEYDYSAGMCKECSFEEEMRERRAEEVQKMMYGKTMEVCG